MEELTPKQQEVIRLVAKGMTNGQIAEHMGISLAGAKWHVGEVLSKYGVNSREEAVRVWKRERSIGARLGRMAAAMPFPKAVAGAGAVIVGVAALVIVAVSIAGGGGNRFARSDVTGHEPLTGNPVVSQGSLFYPEHFANTVTRQVMFAEWSQTDPPPPNPDAMPHTTELWAERDGDGAATVLYTVSFADDGSMLGANRVDQDDSAEYTPGGPAQFNCVGHSERFPELGPTGIGLYGHAGLPAFAEPALLRDQGMSRASDTLLPDVSPPDVERHDQARERLAPDFDMIQSWSGPIDLDPVGGTLTISHDASGLIAGGRLDYHETPERGVPNFILLTEVFNLDVGTELRKHLIPWEEWCPE